MRKRWSVRKSDNFEVEDIEKFLEAIEAVCRKHGLSISHEDGHGGFQIH